MNILLRLLPFLLFSQQALATVWNVGPTRTYTKPSQVSSLVQAGDSIFIDAGVYANDVARWTAPNLLFRGIGGLAHLKCGGTVYGGKAIWVIVGNDVTVENIEFSEAACPDRNGAGIRSEGINLTIRSCYFHDNENGILAGDISSGDILIEHCEFSRNGYSNGQAHNLYINHAHSLTFRYNYSHDALVGHELKSRAYNNYIYCNRISDENGSSSRSIDLPNGGFTILLGNLIVQDPLSENSNLVGYGLEGLSNPGSEFYIAYNTFVNNKSSGSFIQVANGTAVLKVYDNIFAGPGTMIVGAPTLLDTLSNRAAGISAFQFINPAGYNFHLGAGSVAANIATNPGSAGGFSLSPAGEYVHPLNFQPRNSHQDIGAYAGPISSGLATIGQKAIQVSPNPVRDFLLIEGVKLPATVELVDIQGKIFRASCTAQVLDLRELPTGVYWLKIPLETQMYVCPVIKL